MVNLRAVRGWLLLAPLLVGCGKSGPALSPVSGRVTLDGQPVNEAQVVFQPEKAGSPSYGVTDKEGRYELGYKRGQNGALTGAHTVRIQMDTEVLDDAGKPMMRAQLIPPRYNKDSALRQEVRAGGANKIDFDLKSEANSSDKGK